MKKAPRNRRSKTPHASEVRRQRKTRTDIDKHLDELQLCVQDLEKVRSSMDQYKLKSVTVDGATKLARGVKMVNAFSENLEVAVVKAKHQIRRSNLPEDPIPSDTEDDDE